MTQTSRQNRTSQHLSHPPYYGRECAKPQGPMRGQRVLTRVTTWILGLGLMSLSLGGMGADLVHANPPSQNSEYVADVQFWKSDNGSWINLELQNSASSPFLSDVNITATSPNLSIKLEGELKCDHSIGRHNTQEPGGASDAWMYWGTVRRAGNLIHAIETPWIDQGYPIPYMWFLMIGPDWSGAFQKWIAPWEFSTHGWTAEIPLHKIKDGSADIRFRPLEVFQQLVDEYVENGGSRLAFLQQDQTFTVIRPMSLAGYCQKYSDLMVGGGYETRYMPITVKYHGDSDLIADPVSEGDHPDGEAVPFQVTAASVTTQFWDENYEGQCPTNLDFNVTLQVVGQGMVEYRLVNFLGAKSPIYQASFNNGGEHHDTFSHEVGTNSVGGIDGEPDDDIHNPFQPGEPVDDVGIATSDKQFDSWRIEIVSPNALVSDEEFYNWTCVPQPLDVGQHGGVTPLPPYPAQRPGSGNLVTN